MSDDLQMRLSSIAKKAAMPVYETLVEAIDEITTLRARVEHYREEIVELWHGSKSLKPLHEHLGMTLEEYAVWVMAKDTPHAD